MRLSFSKLHGLGNDFILVDLRGDADSSWFEDRAIIEQLCDRHRGVGADGVLGLFPVARAGAAWARLRVRNADGSEAEMCGNGLRCVASWLFGHGAKAAFAIETGAGILGCVVHDNGKGVQVEMGAPRPLFGGPQAAGPWSAEAQKPHLLTLDDTALSLSLVSMGNPHAVTFVGEGPAAPDDGTLMQLAQRLGPAVEKHPLFPQRTNVEFVRRDGPTTFSVVVWERGCGITQACGTGACAVAVAACLRGYATPGDFVSVRLPGGSLDICVAADFSQVLMRGPVSFVFEGALTLPEPTS